MSVWLRFRDLKQRNVVRTRPTLKSWIEKYNFPAGKMAGSERVWTEEEVDTWLANCQTEGPELRGAARAKAKANRGRMLTGGGASCEPGPVERPPESNRVDKKPRGHPRKADCAENTVISENA
jgi:predicted DNA-binding transcriptional regulator AlpA